MNKSLEEKIRQYRELFPTAPTFFFNLHSNSIPDEVKIKLIDDALLSRTPIATYRE